MRSHSLIPPEKFEAYSKEVCYQHKLEKFQTPSFVLTCFFKEIPAESIVLQQKENLDKNTLLKGSSLSY